MRVGSGDGTAAAAQMAALVSSRGHAHRHRSTDGSDRIAAVTAATVDPTADIPSMQDAVRALLQRIQVAAASPDGASDISSLFSQIGGASTVTSSLPRGSLLDTSL